MPPSVLTVGVPPGVAASPTEAVVLMLMMSAVAEPLMPAEPTAPPTARIDTEPLLTASIVTPDLPATCARPETVAFTVSSTVP